jgi:hypothetical protein
MSTIDYTVDMEYGFTIYMGISPSLISGNKLLMNLFETILLSNIKEYVIDDKVVVDENAGNLESTIFDNTIISDNNMLSSAIITTINKTVEILKSSEKQNTPDTEKIVTANLIDLYKELDIVYAKIEIIPKEYELNFQSIYILPVLS